jgi:cytochrome P450
LLSLRDAETGEALSDAEIRDQCATMFVAGSETTARLMFWASYLLAMDPEEQASVRKELAAFAPDRIIGLDDIQNWQRLRCVLLEALRLYPPAPHIFRDANQRGCRNRDCGRGRRRRAVGRAHVVAHYDGE